MSTDCTKSVAGEPEFTAGKISDTLDMPFCSGGSPTGRSGCPVRRDVRAAGALPGRRDDGVRRCPIDALCSPNVGGESRRAKCTENGTRACPIATPSLILLANDKCREYNGKKGHALRKKGLQRAAICAEGRS